MPRKSLIFGNGLGMALNAERFSLDKAIGRVWENNDILTVENKELVMSCLPNNLDRPHGEPELDILQEALSACDTLKNLKGGSRHWLSPEGHDFPDAVRKFIYQVGCQFHTYEDFLPEKFIKTLSTFLKSTKSHVATLNYDNLLYQPLIQEGVLDGYKGSLVDGFWSCGFKPENMKRKYGKNFGYYMHLHGSPLFVDKSGKVKKIPQCNIETEASILSQHIVLTHVRHKPTLINKSQVLSHYWRYLSDALEESDEVIIIGYGGGDHHLNSMMSRAQDIKIRIIEWEDIGDPKTRKHKWRQLLGRDFELIQMKNITEFKDW